MIKKKGKKLLKSENEPPFWFLIIYESIMSVPGIFFGIFLLITFFRFILSYEDLASIFYTLSLSTFFLLLSFFIILHILRNFYSDLIIYEKGIKIRKKIRKYIPFKNIFYAETKIKGFRDQQKYLLVYVKDKKPIIIKGNRIKNSKRALNLILRYKKGIGKQRNHITIIKPFPQILGGYTEKIIQVDCNGSGTIGDPMYIVDTRKLPRTFYFKDFQNYIFLNKVKLKSISLEACKNFTIENSKFSNLKLISCSNIQIKKISIFRRIELEKCQNITIEHSLITKLREIKSSNNIFKNCVIFQLYESASKKNNYVGNTVKLFESSVKKNTLLSRNSFLGNQIKEIKPSIRKKRFHIKHKFLILCLSALYLSVFIILLTVSIINGVIENNDVLASVIIIAVIMSVLTFYILRQYLTLFYYKLKFKKHRSP